MSPTYIQLLAAGNSTNFTSSFSLGSSVALLSPGKSITISLSQPFNTTSISLKFNFTIHLLYGTSIDATGNILSPQTIQAVKGSFHRCKIASRNMSLENDSIRLSAHRNSILWSYLSLSRIFMSVQWTFKCTAIQTRHGPLQGSGDDIRPGKIARNKPRATIRIPCDAEFTLA